MEWIYIHVDREHLFGRGLLDHVPLGDTKMEERRSEPGQTTHLAEWSLVVMERAGSRYSVRRKAGSGVGFTSSVPTGEATYKL